VFGYFGYPLVIKADNGTNFAGCEFHESCRRQGMVVSHSTVNHHVHQVERCILPLRRMVRAVVDQAGRGWVDRLSGMMLSMNRSKATEGDKLSPSERLLGYVLPVPLMGSPALRARTPLEANRSEEWVRPSLTTLIDNLVESQAQLAGEHDKGRHESKVVAGSQVAVPYDLAKKLPITWRPDKVAMKARPLFVGPCSVISVSEGENVSVALGKGNWIKVHASVLKLLPSSVKQVPRAQGQPEDLFWPGQRPKVRCVINCRGTKKTVRYLVVFWGQHEIDGTWVTRDDLAKEDRWMLADYDRRSEEGRVGRVNLERGLDLSAPLS
jgi:hypothetical protein